MNKPSGYLYPDGTRASRKPADGELFHITKNGSTESSWQYDDMLSQWFNVSSGKPTPQNTTLYPYQMAPMDSYELEPTPSIFDLLKSGKTLCDCGLHSVQSNSTRHSTWCKMYDPRAFD